MQNVSHNFLKKIKSTVEMFFFPQTNIAFLEKYKLNKLTQKSARCHGSCVKWKDWILDLDGCMFHQWTGQLLP